MRCRVCGFVADPEAENCPNCGAKLPAAEKKAAAAEGEMSWNTRDFPKPKEMTDIKMSWPDIRSHTVSISEEEIKEALDRKEPVAVLSEDATEGYFSRPAKEEKKEEPKDESKAPEEAPAADAEPIQIGIRTAPELRPDEKDQTSQYWYTQKFTATGVMQTGPAWPVSPANSKPGFPATATIETMTLSDPVPITPEMAAAAAEAASKKQAGEKATSGFTLDDLLEECDDDIPSARPEDHFYTFKKKNEEFQKLLDMEYDRFHAMRGEDHDLMKGNTGRPFAPEETVRAKELSAFERMLLEGVPQHSEETPAQKFFSQDAEPEAETEKPAEPADAAEILQPKHTDDTKDPDPGLFVIPSGDPSKFNIEEIEHTIRELQAQEIEAENNRSERKKRLAAMAAAREAYFASLDAMEEKKHWFSRDRRQERTAGLVKPAEPAKPVEEPVLDTSVLDASPIEGILDDPDAEPTKEIPVGSILKALAMGGVAAASAEAAKTEGDVSSRTRTAAMSAAAPSITEDAFRTRVFTRPLSEEAEELAKMYEQPADAEADASEDLANKYETEEEAPVEEPAAENIPAEEPAAEAIPAEEPAAEEPVEEALVEEAPAEVHAEPEELPSLRELVEQARAAEEAKAEDLANKYEAAEEAPAAPAQAEEPAEEPAPVTEAFIQEAAQEVPAHSTQPFDVDAIEKAAAAALSRPLGAEDAEEDEDDEDDDEPGSRHIVLKIIAIILIVCALFEGAVLGLKKFAPEAPVTESAVQIEEAIGEAVMSFIDSVSDGINRIFHKGN